MAYNLTWDADGERFYESGVSNVALFVYDATTHGYGNGVAWNGVTSISESAEGGDANDLWADNIKYGSMRSTEKVNGSIEAYTYPDEFEACDGVATPVAGMKVSQQTRKKFALCYRTEIGNDETENAGYKLHFLYGCTASPSDRQYDTLNDSPDAMTLSWDYETTPVKVDLGSGNYKNTARIIVDSRDVEETKLTSLLNYVYGTAAQGSTTAVEAKMPDPAKIFELLS